MPNNYYTPTTAFGMGQDDEEETLDYSQADVAVPAAYGAQHPNMVADDNAPRIAAMDENGLQAPAPREDGSVPEDTRTEAQKMAGEQEKLREQYLARYQQAKADASSSTVQGKDGYQYSPVMSDTDKWTDTLLKGAAALFMVGMPAAGIAAAAMTWMGNSDKQHRQGQIRHLEEKGYKGRDIQAWIDSGDHRFLAEDKVENKYITPGAGRVFDTSTGQWVEAPGAVPGGSPTDSKPYKDENGEWWQPQWNTDGSAKPPKHLPNYGKNKGGNGGDGSTSSSNGDDPDIFERDGEWWQRQYDSKGNPKPPKHLKDFKKNVAYEGGDLDSDEFREAKVKLGLNTTESTKLGHVRNAVDAYKAFSAASKETTTSGLVAQYNKSVPDIMKSDQYQKYQKSGDRLLMAVLRDESGAAIPPDEIKNYRDTYIPQPWDGIETRKMKIQALETALKKLSDGTGKASPYADTSIQNVIDSLKAETAELEKAEKGGNKESRGAEFDNTKPGAKPKEEQKSYAKGKFGDKYVDLRRNSATGKVEGRKAGSSVWEVAQ